MAEPQTETYPCYSQEWKDAVPTAEQKDFVNNPSNNWIKCAWPNITDSLDYENARRFGHTTNPKWVNKFYALFFDGGWQGSASVVDEGTLIEKKKASIVHEMPRIIGAFEPPCSENQRIMSFWTNSQARRDEGLGPVRVIDTTGTVPYCDIQLGLLIALMMYNERETWSKDDFEGRPITREDLFLTPLVVMQDISKVEKDKINKFLDSLKDGIPEIVVKGRRHQRTSTPGREAKAMGQYIEAVKTPH
ncbi:uncharacterized protein J4E87_008159 [Alternaria ethzedia]|uniref:uncharacterized protein n=1 Tax=Alternaria ethzedia TaxID=181014 RepID=UPI0020C3F085|nr:uncharacterized protein J4E87_008159 [Alternaria ethzedia]KAI4618149.1 hypothetical protein J4E87_008159 [Alternaria ethzedia]